jgi:hypothetical protein
MMKNSKVLAYIDKIANIFEVAIGVFLLIVIAVMFAEIIISTVGFDVVLIGSPFQTILSASFSLVIGVEFIKMLYKHTPESVIDVLLFATARQTVIYYEGTADLLLGVAAIAGLFAAKRFLINRLNGKVIDEKNDKDEHGN